MADIDEIGGQASDKHVPKRDWLGVLLRIVSYQDNDGRAERENDGDELAEYGS